MPKQSENHIGERFGNITIIHQFTDKQRLVGKHRSVCRCDCGKEWETSTNNITRTDGSVSCGCRNKEIINLGDKFSKWTVLEVLGENKQNVLCRCCCGLVKLLTRNSLITKRSNGCMHCAHDGNNPLTKFESYLNKMKRGLFKRKKLINESFSLTPEIIRDLIEKQEYKCFISGISINLSEKTASIDRIDSRIGYNPKNIQWVHKIVNFMKGVLSDQEFAMYCEKITDYQRSKNTSNYQI